MKLRLFAPVIIAGCAMLLTSGCAYFSKGSTQTVEVHSSPEGATAFINGHEVGTTPFKVNMKRTGAYTIELKKDGYNGAAGVLLPVANEYEKRFLRWGIDYELGAMTDLTPGVVKLELTPALPTASTPDERFKEMTYRVLQADALLASKDITPSDHKYLVEQIVKFYTN